MSKLIIKFLPIFFIFTIVTLLFGKALVPSEGQVIYGGDLADQFYYWKSYYVNSIRKGVIPFWNPYNFSGTPFLAHPSVAPFYPFNLIFFIFPLNIAFSVFLFVHITMAGFFMYFLARRKLDRLSSLVSASVFAQSGYFAARIYSGHIDIISTIVWTPLVFGTINQAIEKFRKKEILMAVLALTMQILAGYQFAVMMTLELVFLVWGIRVISRVGPSLLKLWRAKKTWGIKLIRELAVLGLIVISAYGLASVQFLPTYEFVRNSVRSSGLPYSLVTWGSYSLDNFKLFDNPYIYGDPFPESYSYFGPGPNFFELFYFVGRIPLILIVGYIIIWVVTRIIGSKDKKILLIQIINQKDIGGILLAIVFFALLALGVNFPLHKIFFDLVPPYRLFRFPAQHLMMVVFLLSLLAGRAVSSVKINLIKCVILLLIVVELLSFSKRFIRIDKVPTQGFDVDLITALKQDNELVRLVPDFPVVSRVRGSLDFESASYYRIQTTSGYNPILLNNYYQFIDLLNRSKESSIAYFNVEIPPPDPYSPYINFLNVKYVLVDPAFNTIINQPPANFKLLIEKSKYKLYQNTSYLPRFFLVGNISLYPTRKALEDEMINNQISLDRKALFTKEEIREEAGFNLNCKDEDIGQIQLASYTPNKIKLKAEVNCNSFLSSSEVYYPGWKARLNGKEENIFLSNGSFRSIYLPNGNHQVEFYYQPTIYYIGGVISLVTGMMLIVFLKRL